MTKITALLTVLTATLLTCGTARAHGEFKCDVPQAEWRKQMDLQRKLLDDGWKKVRQIKVDNGCYEVYGFDEAGKRAEVYFNPKTFEKIGAVKQPD